MRYFLLSLITLFSFSTFVTSANAKSKGYGMAGCGLGSIVMGPNGMQISAATTNNTSASQAFGISSGTSNCMTSEEMALLRTQQEYIAINLGSVSKDMARGNGDSLYGLAETLGCNAKIFPSVAKQLKRGYSQIFAAPGAMAVLDKTKEYLLMNKNISQNCHNLTI